jgi:hypothetical protein
LLEHAHFPRVIESYFKAWKVRVLLTIPLQV